MIKLKLTNQDLEARPDIKKWVDKVEKVLNNKFPEERLNKIREDIMYYIMTGESYTIDSEGNVRGYLDDTPT